jgi:superfamily II DNA or RNA helicase/diadenosine tetraphosphate (Ap4A) HIT family hydrolase/HKD family nuclease
MFFTAADLAGTKDDPQGRTLPAMDQPPPSPFLEVPEAEWVCANNLCFAIFDSFPVSPGHVLVITRRVVPTFFECTAAEQQALMELVGEVKALLDERHDQKPDGFNVGFNSGAAAGQTVPHVHVHVIPRYAGDMGDPRGGVRHVIPEKGNYLSPGGHLSSSPPMLVTPFEGKLRLELTRCLIREDMNRIDLLVSFVKRSGLGLIAHRIDEALARGAHIRLLTTDYLCITDAGALGFFLDRIAEGPPGRLEARVFSDPATSFHPKAYIFWSTVSSDGVAFVGSSNLTHAGINTGVEWNVRTFGTKPLVEEFDQLWHDARSIPLAAEWLAGYENQQREFQGPLPPGGATLEAAAVGDEGRDEALRPWSVQAEAMTALEATRRDGHQAGLVVMATGLGKTWLAAFDSSRTEFPRVLFVAHREEILRQARDVFRQVRPGASLTLFVGDDRDPHGDVVFASVQSLCLNLSRFDPQAFDYIIIDEFHHAAAPTYRTLISHFRPLFLLGLTATPSRADNADLLALCSDNVVFDCGLVEGVRRGLLSPFQYRAIPDVADYENVPWRNGRFDPDVLTSHVATNSRAEQVFEEWESAGGDGRRTLAFCCTIEHADFMASFFHSRGVAAVAVHSGHLSTSRVVAIEQLGAGLIPIIFAVDLFNEGVDVPAIDLVLMLRPTESSTVFLQQLGRGLRRAEGKTRLDVVDLVGNHRGFLLKARILAKLGGSADLTDREAVALLAGHPFELVGQGGLPEGCAIIVAPQVIDLLQQLIGPMNEHDKLVDLVRQWADEHEGRRPTALEIAVLSGQALAVRKKEGWFDFLDGLGMLDPREREVAEQFRGFLLWIERGNYTKSYKLITLLSLLQLGGLRLGADVVAVAEQSRRLIFRDNDLLADLADAGSAFADVTSPEPHEWLRYWQRNPIAAITSATRGATPWFRQIGNRLEFNAEVELEYSRTFDAMVQELVDYRLHRYLAARDTRRSGEWRRLLLNGVDIDASLVVESTGVTATSVVIESSGGTKGEKGAKNLDYVQGFDLILQRLASLNVLLLDALVDTRTTSTLAVADRRLKPGDQIGYPIRLAQVADLKELRRALLRSMAKVGQASGAKGSGNARKRTRLVISTSEPWTALKLADALASG